MDPPITVLLVDGHQGVRAALTTRLTGLPGVRTVAQAPTIDDALRMAQEDAPDVALYDPLTVGADPAEAVLRLRRTGCPVVVLTSSVLETEEKALLHAGVAGILLKGLPIDHLLAQLQSAVRHHPRPPAHDSALP